LDYLDDILECSCGSKGLKDFDLVIKCPLVFECNKCHNCSEISCQKLDCLDCAKLGGYDDYHCR